MMATWPNRREAAISGNKKPSFARKSPHRLLILTFSTGVSHVRDQRNLFYRDKKRRQKFMISGRNR